MNKFPKDHEKLMREIVDDYTSTRAINNEELERGLNFLYGLSGFKTPDVVVFDSPYKLFEYFLKHANEQPIHQAAYISDKLYTAFRRNQLKLISADLRNKVDKEIRIKINSSHRRAVRQAESLVFPMGSITSDVMMYDWVACRDFYNQTGVIDDDKFKEYIRYTKLSGVFFGIYLFKEALISKNPIMALKDEKGRLHNTEGPAIQWSDGFSLNSIKGIFFDNDLFKKIFINKEITPKEIIELRNTEQKAVTIQYYGYDKLIDELGAEKLDVWETKSLVNGNTAVCELYQFALDSNISWVKNLYRFVKVQDHSTGKITTLGVPVEKWTETAKGAVAWTFCIPADRYNPYLET